MGDEIKTNEACATECCPGGDVQNKLSDQQPLDTTESVDTVESQGAPKKSKGVKKSRAKATVTKAVKNQEPMENEVEEEKKEEGEGVNEEYRSTCATDTAKGAKRKYKKSTSATDKPKRVKNAYFWFAGENRSSIIEQGVTNVTEISKILGGRWKEMTMEEKAPYIKMYEDAKEAQRAIENA